MDALPAGKQLNNGRYVIAREINSKLPLTPTPFKPSSYPPAGDLLPVGGPGEGQYQKMPIKQWGVLCTVGGATAIVYEAYDNVNNTQTALKVRWMGLTWLSGVDASSDGG